MLHEITLLYFRAGDLPAALGRSRRAFAYPHSQARGEADTGRSAQTNRTCKAPAKSISNPLRKAGPLSAGQTKIFRIPIRLSCFFSLCFSFPKAIAVSERPFTQTRRRTRHRRR